MSVKKILVKDVSCKRRIRKDMGDIDSLAESIAEVGLLHPIVVNSDFELIVGERRLRAFKKLKEQRIPALIVKSLDEAMNALKAERDENTCRKSFTPEEAVKLGLKLEKLEKPKAKAAQRQSNGRPKKGREKNPTLKQQDESKRVREQVGSSVGMSGRTYEKAKAVVESGDAEAIEQMNRTGKVGPAHNRVKQKKKKQKLEEKAEQVKQEIKADYKPQFLLVNMDVCEGLESIENATRPWDDQDEKPARLIFTDPPYNIGIDYGKGANADLLSDQKYLDWCEQWMTLCWNALSDDGSFWLLVNDEYAAELCSVAKSVGFYRRAWIKWFEGFGVNCTNNFNRTTRHISKLQLIVEVAKRRGTQCFYAPLGGCSADVEIDRIRPGSKGGKYTIANCVLACRAHNNARRDRSIEEFLNG